MTSFHLVNPSGLYDPGPNGYSHLANVPPGRRFVLVSGQGGEAVDGQLSTDFATQVRKAFSNMRVALAAADAQPRHVARLLLLVVDHNEERLKVIGAELDRVWGDAPKPACTLVPVPKLALKGMLFEVEATAVVLA
jgi:enamine deaminase RidA (YjgF/YER057c/UK114 family)